MAIANGWAISANLDQKVVTLATLRAPWEALRIKYVDLWSKWYEDGSASRFVALQHRANDLAVLASSGSPWNPRVVERWERFVDARLEKEVGK